jgi:hypothetical protein
MKRSVCVLTLVFILGGIGLAQEIKVTQPASGVTWNIGGTYLVQWTPTGTTKPTVKIMLWQGATDIMDIVASTPNSGSYSWTIPTTVAPGTYKVRVRTIGDNIVGIGAAFNIASASTPTPPIKVFRPIDPGDRAGLRFKFPALSISDVKLTPTLEGFVVTFGYKNSGTGPLPKGSEMPVKPNFRVLIDNREVNQGSLIFPAFPAPPGWEVPAFYGCDIKYQTAPRFDKTWTIGNVVTVKINENKVNGMESDSQSYNLKPMALNYSYDAILTGATLDWDKEILTVHVRFDGKLGSFSKFRLSNTGGTGSEIIDGYGSFYKTISLVPGQRLYSITQKIAGVSWKKEFKVFLGVVGEKSPGEFPDVRDIEHRNNHNIITFKR